MDDVEMRDAKKGQFYLTEGQRSLANNSAVYNEKPSAAQFLDEWVALAKSGTGERGIFNRGGLRTMLPERRLRALKGYIGNLGTNPCVVADTWVMTQDGARQVKDLIHQPFAALVNGRSYASSGFFPTGVKPVFDVQTDRGFQLRATGNHKILTVQYRSRKVQRNEWKEVDALQLGDEIVLQRHASHEWGGDGTEGEGWLLGSLLGDGNIEKNGKANLDYWGITQPAMMRQAVALVHQTVGARSDLVGHVASTGYGRVQSMNLGRLAASYGLVHGNKAVSVAVERASSAFYKGFLRGWFDADGSMQGTQQKGVSVRLTAVSYENLAAAQRMLARLGIISSIYRNRRTAQERLLPDGHGGKKSYACAACHELIVSGANVVQFSDIVGFNDPEKRTKLARALSAYRRTMNRERFSARVTSITPAGNEAVYDCTVPEVHAFDANGVCAHNCGEIILQSRQFCNLSEIVARPEDTLESLIRKCRVATILGTYQSTLTNFGYLSKEWKENCEAERLLGVSITGQWDSSEVRKPEVLKKLKEVALRVN
ncbi:MAG: ribonucleoside-triphosphate reductase, adenosylcobalamin-dependent, partial [Candidatus Harrisonbacteria bacterium]|nr:ribonucleoside-triphosphate reductase, adenosylcobalamin-dependent [Candidatus Harrisonbacteria bacterium]